MKFRILVRCVDGSGDPRWEEYEKHVSDPEKWALETIVRFNATLTPFEKERELVKVEVLDVDAVKDHD